MDRQELPDVPISWLCSQVERHIALGGEVTDPQSGRVLASLRDWCASDDGQLGVEMEIIDERLGVAIAEKRVRSLSFGISYSQEGEAQITEVCPTA